MKKTRLAEMQAKMQENPQTPDGKTIAAVMEAEYQQLCSGDAGKPKDFIRHLHNNIYPAAAAFRALMQQGMAREEAAKLAGDTFLELMQSSAASIQKLCRIPGFYRLVPGLFGRLMPKLFKKEAGFEFAFHAPERGRVQFDMLRCPYLEACRELDCIELAPVFCETDDICYGNMHPKLFWNRTQTLARGGTLCDFDLRIRDASGK